jgi:hypothetical protein
LWESIKFNSLLMTIITGADLDKSGSNRRSHLAYSDPQHL